MRRIWLLSLAGVGLGVGCAIARYSPSSQSPQSGLPTASTATPTSATVLPATDRLQYRSYTLPNSIVHTLKIPAQGHFEVVPAVSETVETPAAIAQREGAIAALNGGFFDPENQQSTAFIVLHGQQVADPRQNQSLMQNPALTPYLGKILNRSEFRQYQCGDDRRQFDLTLHSAAIPTGCKLVSALGGGPRLLPESTAQQEGFVAIANGVVIRDALGSRQPNARTAIGITRDRGLLWVMVAQKLGATDSGMTLQALADFMKTMDVEQAMNLDGGSSSSLYYNGNTFYGKLDSAGNAIHRPVKSVLLVKRNP